jgi:hypothetical protein
MDSTVWRNGPEVVGRSAGRIEIVRKWFKIGTISTIRAALITTKITKTAKKRSTKSGNGKIASTHTVC